tara:strand:- start:3112 stop:3309 length:198 start_codon:yes stop_codon:yes gene_type:complete
MTNRKEKWFSNKKGYGFITTDQGDELFVHYSEIRGEGFKTLSDNQNVEFEMGTGEKGAIAKNVVR